MPSRRIAACAVVFLLVLLWGWQANRDIRRLEASDVPPATLRGASFEQSPDALLMPPFRPREYVRIISRRPE